MQVSVCTYTLLYLSYIRVPTESLIHTGLENNMGNNIITIFQLPWVLAQEHVSAWAGADRQTPIDSPDPTPNQPIVPFRRGTHVVVNRAVGPRRPQRGTIGRNF